MSFTLLVDRLGFNSITPMIIVPIFVGLYIIFHRRDLFKIAIISAVILTILTFLWQLTIQIIIPEFILQFWMLENLSGILILGIPIEELLFAFAFGFGESVYYKFMTGTTYKQN